MAFGRDFDQTIKEVLCPRSLSGASAPWALDVLNGPKPLKRSPGILKFRAAGVCISVDFTCLLQNKWGRAFVICAENDWDLRCVSAFWVSLTQLLHTAEAPSNHRRRKIKRHFTVFLLNMVPFVFALRLLYLFCFNEQKSVLSSFLGEVRSQSFTEKWFRPEWCLHCVNSPTMCCLKLQIDRLSSRGFLYDCWLNKI